MFSYNYLINKDNLENEAPPALRVSGITAKLFIWLFISVLIFFTTVFVLYINVHRMMRISESIIDRNYKISSESKKILEQLLRMEENEKKYRLIPEASYRDYFLSAQTEFEKSLEEIIQIDRNVSGRWRLLYDRYKEIAPSREAVMAGKPADGLWIPESEIDAWIDTISSARLKNEREIENANRELNRRGLWTVRAGLAGLAVAVVIGIAGALFLAHSMIRPIGELLKGIRSVSHDSAIRPITVQSKDEFGELATSFNEMAQRLTEEQRMRSDFISMLSHEIRTPLTSIRESINLISEGIMGDTNERQRRFLDIAGQEMTRVSNLLNRIMQVSYLESGTLEIEKKPIPAEPFVNECLARVKGSAETKGISLTADIPPRLPSLLGDAGYLGQVLDNILGNALKFTPTGGSVMLRAAAEEKQRLVRITISDDGPGIPKIEQPFIFNKYYRAKATRGRSDGAGLCLSIARHIVEAHGGRIRVVGDEGKGATISFTIPAATKASSA